MPEPRPDAGSMSLLAHAKLNVWLRVLAREEGGYHSIETLMLRLELADRLELETTDEPGIRLEVRGGPEVPSDSTNLCWRAAEALRNALGHEGGARIRLEKSIPAGAGLGGGSADAAAVLRGFNGLWGNRLNSRALTRLAGELGSDVPFGLCETPMALAWERGRRLLPLEAPPSRPVLIVVPGYPIGAGEAYGWLAEDRAAGLDLEEPVFRRHPDLAGIRDLLLDRGADVALLCGSGSCVAGLFSDESVLARAVESFHEAESLSTIRTRTLS
jgi:4-diphosphocytidyl-2-C-methyl-D-erythritol kinase